MELVERTVAAHAWRAHWPADGVARRGIVLLFGWWFGEHKHLDKYSALWSSLGYCVVQVTNQSLIMRLGTPSFVAAARSLHEVCAALQASQPPKSTPLPVFVHAFSNGGLANLYHFVSAVLPRPTRLSGVVLDSCPGDITLFGGARAISATQTGVLKYLLFSLFVLLGSIGRWLLPLLGITRFHLSNQSMGHDLLLTSPALRTLPFLYLFGPDDRIVDCRFIRQTLQAQRDSGMQVRAVEFGGSDHVAHFRKHAEQYASAIETFVETAATSK